MKIRRFIIKNIFVAALVIAFISCTNKEIRVEGVGEIPVYFADSALFISTNDAPLFSGKYSAVSILRSGLAVVEKDGNYGFIDDNGEFVLPTVYKQCSAFKDGVAWVVRKGDSPGLINRKGELKFTLRQAEEVEIFFEGAARFSIKERGKLRYGFISETGETIIHPYYYGATHFSQGRASVEDMNGKWGYIDKNDTVVLPAIYDEARLFISGKAVVRIGSLFGAIDENGKYVIKPKFNDLIPDGEFFMASQKGLWGWCDGEGKWIINPIYPMIGPFHNSDLAPVLINGRWGYINREGELSIKRQFDMAYPFLDDIAAVKIGPYYGFINKEGVYVINPQYTGISQDYISNAVCGETYYSTVKSGR